MSRTGPRMHDRYRTGMRGGDSSTWWMRSFRASGSSATSVSWHGRSDGAYGLKASTVAPAGVRRERTSSTMALGAHFSRRRLSSFRRSSLRVLACLRSSAGRPSSIWMALESRFAMAEQSTTMARGTHSACLGELARRMRDRKNAALAKKMDESKRSTCTSATGLATPGKRLTLRHVPELPGMRPRTATWGSAASLMTRTSEIAAPTAMPSSMPSTMVAMSDTMYTTKSPLSTAQSMRGVVNSTSLITAKMIMLPRVTSGRYSKSPVRNTTTMMRMRDEIIPASGVLAPASALTEVRLKPPVVEKELKKAPTKLPTPRPTSSWLESTSLPKRSAMALATLMDSMKPTMHMMMAEAKRRPASLPKFSSKRLRGVGIPESILPTMPTPSLSRPAPATMAMLTTTTTRALGNALMICIATLLALTDGTVRRYVRMYLSR
mmetsp:Transcript_13132/g.50230  ORF Transcript_13132/g.50230 Transcript_13132/m.50230 type:complete len:436 (-) Transcript_13132:692-1999(-)